MGLKDLLKGLLGGGAATTPAPTRPQPAAPAKPRRRQRMIAVFTLDDAFKNFMAATLKPLTQPDDCEYFDNPPLDVAIKCQIIVFDISPEVDAKMHHRYDQILRVKKSMSKMDDILAVVGPRAKYVAYPRGTYPKLRYFCVENSDYTQLSAGLPKGGQETQEGPTLHNLADLKDIAAKKMEDLKFVN
ncbi:MAG TPA: hypothetical protein P5137_08855 [Candidatus Brocadiia bacterium]|nr:hypothetical protein [Candidatus Brocadiia bacterium]